MNKDEIISTLKTVKYSNFDRDIISLGMLKYLKCENNEIEARIFVGKNTAEGEKTVEKMKAVLSQKYPNANITVSLLAENPDAQAMPQNKDDVLKDIKIKIAVASGKGGVGKSTVAINLARAFARIFGSGNVALMDCDLYGPSASLLAGEKSKLMCSDSGKILPKLTNGIKMVSMGLLVDDNQALIWRGPMVMSALKQFVNDVDWGKADAMILDLPPGTGDAVLSAVQLMKIDGALVVTTPNELASITALRGSEIFTKTDIPILGVVENMAYLEMPDGSKNYIFGQSSTAQKVASELNSEVLAEIPIDKSLQNFGENAQSQSSQTLFDNIAKAIIAKVKK